MSVWLVAPLPALLAAALVGAVLDRGLRLGLGSLGPLAWALRVALALGLGVMFVVHPLAGALALAGLVALRGARALEVRATVDARGGLALAALVWLASIARPPGVLFWDEAVWLAKVRLAAGDPTRLVAAALDASADVVPRGYPLVASLGQAALAGFSGEVSSGVAGAAALGALAFALGLALLPGSRRRAFVVALACAPLAWVHLRSAYLDLPLGMLALAVAAGLGRGDAASVRGAAIAALWLVGAKDEGLVHLAAILAAHLALRGRDPEARRAAGIVGLSGLVPWVAWRALLVTHGIANRDHALGFAGLADAGSIGLEVLRASVDLRSWGLGWPLAAAAALVAWRVDHGRGRAPALTLGLQLGALVAALVLGSERLRVFALDGSLVNRLLVQLAPMAAWLVAEVVAPAPSAEGRPREAPVPTRAA